MNTDEIAMKKARLEQERIVKESEKKNVVSEERKKEIYIKQAREDIGDLFWILFSIILALLVFVGIPIVLNSFGFWFGVFSACILWIPLLTMTVGVRFLAWCRLKKDERISEDPFAPRSYNSSQDSGQ